MTIAYVSETDAGRRLGVTRQRVSALIKAGKIKTTIIAGRPLITKQELERVAKIARKPGRPRSKD
jgi:hypothetical protein